MNLIEDPHAKAAVSFLTDIYKDNIVAAANIINARAENNIDVIIEDLQDVINGLNALNNKLLEIKEKSC